MGHYTNWENGWSYQEDYCRGNAAKYNWQINPENLCYFGLTTNEAQELQSRFNDYEKYFLPGDEHRYDGIIIPNTGR